MLRRSPSAPHSEMSSQTSVLPTAPPPLSGLSQAEAAERLRRVGPNILAPAPRWAGLREAAETLADPMALMLLAAAVVYLVVGETRDGIVMLAALIPVLGVDVFLAARSRNALQKLAAAVPPEATVLRDGREQTVPARELVPGDLLLLQEGDILHADGVLRCAANLTLAKPI
ncbi:MAG: hypothetical protein FJX77_13520 [Armatimonadetes bacterium]|nr:hypothetical protein [Armatimonadota bacterium]